MQTLFNELVKAAAQRQAEEIRQTASEVFGGDDAGEIIKQWDEANPRYFEVLADDPHLFASQIKKFKSAKEVENELNRLKKEGGEEVIKRVKETLKTVERLKVPMETGSGFRRKEGKNSRLLNNILNTINN
jgi:hypothetical protein